MAKRLTVLPSQPPVFERHEQTRTIKFYGSIYNKDILSSYDYSTLNETGFVDLLLNLGGFFLAEFVDHAHEMHMVANDLFGNYRVYLVESEEKLFLFDEYMAAHRKAKEAGLQFTVDRNEQFYFERHRYTTGGATLYEPIRKLMPATILVNNGDRIISRIYYRAERANQCDGKLYAEKTVQLVAENIINGLVPDRPNILFYTGGVDSTYLAGLLQERQIEFTSVFVKYQPQDKDNRNDEQKVKQGQRWLPDPVRTIEVPIADCLQHLKTAVRRHPFDKTLAVPFYEALKRLRNELGPCNIINGQSSDSIFCWGASSKTIGGLIQRLIASRQFVVSHRMVRWLVASIAQLLYRARGKIGQDHAVPYVLPDYYAGLLDPTGYLPVVHRGDTYAEYNEYLRKIVAWIADQLEDNPDAIIMYMKLMYLQGTSNRFVIEAINEYGHNAVLPFVDARLLSLRMSMQREWHNLFYPRYVLENTLRNRYRVDIDSIPRGKAVADRADSDADFEKLLEKVYEQWDRLFKELY